jgi:hypothetical protein
MRPLGWPLVGTECGTRLDADFQVHSMFQQNTDQFRDLVSEAERVRAGTGSRQFE